MCVYIWDIYYNLIWALLVWAVVLINEDRIGNIFHGNILEMHIRSSPNRGSRPCFDSNTIICIDKSGTNNSDSWNRLFVLVLAKTSNTDTMARPTSYLVNSNIMVSITNGDAIITCSNIGIGNVDLRWTSNVDSISVGAICRCSYGNMLELQVLAFQKVDVEKFAVLWCNVLDYWICDEVEPYILFMFTS